MNKWSLALLLVSAASAQLNTSAIKTPTNDYQISVSVPPGAAVDLTSSSASGKKLLALECWSSVATKLNTFTVNNGTESTNPVSVGGSPASVAYWWKTPDPEFIVLGSSAGTDAFRVRATNLDSANAADIACVFRYSN